MTKKEKPKCRACGKPLRKFRYRNTWGKTSPSEWGDYGDGRFCGLTCGYRWAVRHSDVAPGAERP